MKIHTMKLLKYLVLTTWIIVLSLQTFGQGELQREVRVVKPYTPTLSDADKIGLNPEFNDTTSYQVNFNYNIRPVRYSTSFRLQPIKPAKMVGLPLERLYKSQLTLGVGNYRTPFAEITVNQLRDRKSAIGLYAKHHSSTGKVRLPDDTRADAPFSDNEVELYAHRFFRNSALDLSINGGYNSWLYYGDNPFIDTFFVREQIQQKVYQAGASLNFHSTHADSSHFNYEVGMDYYYLEDHYNFGEHGIDIGLNMGNFIGDWYGNIDLGMELYSRTQAFDTTNNSLIRINPNFSKATDNWRFLVGLNSALDTRGGKTALSLYPRAEFEFNIVQNVLIPYMGITGDKKVSSYKRLLEENPFITPGLIADNEDYGIVGFLGLKGKYSSKMAFDLRAKYSRVFYMYSFVNQYLDVIPRNQFFVLYDDVDVFNAGAEVAWNYSDQLKFILHGNYYDYNVDVYHKPNLEIGLNATYNLRDKILVDANLFYTGKRNAFLPTGNLPATEPETIEMKAYFDGNLKAEYRYTRLLSFFIKLNNFSASRYEEWYLYPVQRFQIMAGFTYAL